MQPDGRVVALVLDPCVSAPAAGPSTRDVLASRSVDVIASCSAMPFSKPPLRFVPQPCTRTKTGKQDY
jgi:hypothetical protein